MGTGSDSTGDETTKGEPSAEAEHVDPSAATAGGEAPTLLVDLTEQKVPSRRFYANLTDL